MPDRQPFEPGPIGKQPAEPGLLSADATGSLTDGEIDALWELFQQIGRIWNNVWNDSAGQRSSWLEFVNLRCHEKPSYLAEYRNAIAVIQELVHKYGMVEAYERLLIGHKPADEPPRPIQTRFDHTRAYVVNEFIRVQVVAGGFRGFGGKQRAYNFNGFVRGTRYNRVQRVRAYRPIKKSDTRGTHRENEED